MEKCIGCGMDLGLFESPTHRIHRMMNWYFLNRQQARVLVLKNRANEFERKVFERWHEDKKYYSDWTKEELIGLFDLMFPIGE